MISGQPVRIRSLHNDDIGKALCLSSSEGWNQTGKDWSRLIGNPLNTCIAAEYENRIIGTATALNHDCKVAWIGMVLVDKEFRGQGIGKLLMTTMIERLGKFDSIKLDATPAGLPLYRKLGFVDEYMIDRMFNPSVVSNEIPHQNKIPELIKITDLKHIAEKDEDIFGVSRYSLFEKLYEDFPEKALKLDIRNTLSAYIFGRGGLKYHYIGPCVASSADSAFNLITSALVKLRGQPAILDIPQDKQDLIKWLESGGFQKQRHFTRMYFKSNSFKGIIKNYYLISGPEYG